MLYKIKDYEASKEVEVEASDILEVMLEYFTLAINSTRY